MIAKILDSVVPTPDQAAPDVGRRGTSPAPAVTEQLPAKAGSDGDRHSAAPVPALTAPDQADPKKKRPSGKKPSKFTTPPASATKREAGLVKSPIDKRVAGEEAAERKPNPADTARAVKKAKIDMSSRSTEGTPAIPDEGKTKKARKILLPDNSSFAILGWAGWVRWG